MYLDWSSSEELKPFIEKCRRDEYSSVSAFLINGSIADVINWADSNLKGKMSYWAGKYWFEDEKDRLLFIMTWITPNET